MPGPLLPSIPEGTVALLGAVLLAASFLRAAAAVWSLRASRRRARAACRADLDAFDRRVADALERHAAAQRTRDLVWSGFRPFVVVKKEAECADVVSVYLESEDERPLPPFRPGQFVVVRLRPPDDGRAVVRCYSLSAAPDPGFYRLTVKRVGPPADAPDAPPGAASTCLHDHVGVGDTLELRAPDGTFHLDPDDIRSRPIVLVGGGVGVTPLVSMLEDLAGRAPEDRPPRVDVFLGFTSAQHHVLRGSLAAVADASDVHVTIAYSRPTGDERPPGATLHRGRIDLDLLRARLPALEDRDYYVCGPGAMMADLERLLRTAGVDHGRIHHEAFGPAAVRRTTRVFRGSTGPAGIRFSRSDREIRWDPDRFDTILDAADCAGVAIPAGCRAGHCQTCAVPVATGSFAYLEAPPTSPGEGFCLPCIAVPRGMLTIDA